MKKYYIQKAFSNVSKQFKKKMAPIPKDFVPILPPSIDGF